jgi:hypothetical protein
MKSRSILVFVMISFLSTAAVNAKYSGGTGEPNDPYKIATAEDLNDIGNHTEDFNKCFILVNDINLAQYTGTQFKRIGTSYETSFTGVFDGNNQKVWNFTWTSNDFNYVGLFGFVGSSGQIKDLGMENVDVNDPNGLYVGGLVGKIWLGAITNCYLTGSVTGFAEVGGLVGENAGTITNCYFSDTVSGIWGVGGLVGGNERKITNCYSKSIVTGGDCVGGLVGYETGVAEINNSYSTGSVSGGDYVGGLVGDNENSGKISNCYSTVSVEGEESVGGLVGGNEFAHITNCYSTGSVKGGECVGGLAGRSAGLGVITNCYSTGSVTGDIDVGGLVGCDGGVAASFWDVNTSGQMTSAGGTGKTTIEMKTLSTFTSAGWDFIEIWGIEDNQTYPFLKLTYPVGDLDLDKDVDFQDFAHFADYWLEETGT